VFYNSAAFVRHACRERHKTTRAPQEVNDEPSRRARRIRRSPSRPAPNRDDDGSSSAASRGCKIRSEPGRAPAVRLHEHWTDRDGYGHRYRERACTKIPEETAGPYPGEGSNGPNVLNQTGVVRSDIRSSFAGLTGTADGVPLTIALTIVSASTCAVLANRAVYLWHWDRAGRYSLYSSGVTSQNYLRGVQEADANGKVAFTSIFPACYSGRWPHIHFEVYPSLAAATNVANKIATSQLALPKAACDLVHATTGHESSVTNLSQVTLATDNVFSDGSSLELATVTGRSKAVSPRR